MERKSMKHFFKMDAPKYELKENIILRDYLALERTKLANERTLFAYIRRSLYLILAGMTLIQLRELASIQWIGIVSLIFSLFILGIGIFRYIKLDRELKYYYSKQNDTNL